MSDVLFTRFYDQCNLCSCYCKNADPEDIFDAECSLEQDTTINTPCDFYDQIKIHVWEEEN